MTGMLKIKFFKIMNVAKCLRSCVLTLYFSMFFCEVFTVIYQNCAHSPRLVSIVSSSSSY